MVSSLALGKYDEGDEGLGEVLCSFDLDCEHFEQVETSSVKISP